ncbi:hypothetical protein GOODEAATRI_023964 [Goodea atripinnis]|uniref:Uncharacterized protein n=1 Tax=Goodea atripinnis TaxID=208336 RepID=A0ABV0P7D4_9TELE
MEVKPLADFLSRHHRLGVIQAVFFGLCVLIDVSSLLTKGADSREQERQLKKLIGLRDWMMAVLAFPVGAQAAERREQADQGTIEEGLASDASNWNTGDRQWLNHGMVRPTFSTPIKSRVCSFLVCCQQTTKRILNVFLRTRCTQKPVQGVRVFVLLVPVLFKFCLAEHVKLNSLGSLLMSVDHKPADNLLSAVKPAQVNLQILIAPLAGSFD